jgi:laminin alpha 3/5
MEFFFVFQYFYSIKDISIGGRCMCNGHADTCDITDPNDPYKLLCRCQHHTCGGNCDTCCPGFQQKAWRQSKSYQPFVCERECFMFMNKHALRAWCVTSTLCKW